MNKIPIVLCTDEYNFAGLFVTMNSILKNCSNPSRLHFSVLVSSTTLKTLLGSYTKKLFGDVTIQIEVFNDENQRKIAGYNEFCAANTHCKNMMNFARFFIPDIFQEFKHFLYIDTDYLILDDILSLWDSIDKQQEFYAVPSEYTNKNAYSLTEEGEKFLTLSIRRPFNAGIYIVNADIWRMKQRTVQFIGLINSPKIQRMFRFGTQPLLNYVFQEDYIYLPTRWNRIAYDNVGDFGGQRIIDLLNGLNQNELVKEGISAVHFAGMPKPWLFTNQLSGGCWPSPNDIYKQYLPYKATLRLNYKLIQDHKELMLKFLTAMNDFFSINVIFIQSNNSYTDFEKCLDEQCRTTPDSYKSSTYYIVINNKIIMNMTGLPNEVVDQIYTMQPEKKEGLYILTQMEGGIHFHRKNIFEEIPYLNLAGDNHLTFLRLIFAYIFLEKL